MPLISQQRCEPSMQNSQHHTTVFSTTRRPSFLKGVHRAIMREGTIAALRSFTELGCFTCSTVTPSCGTMRNAPVLLLSRRISLLASGSLPSQRNLGNRPVAFRSPANSHSLARQPSACTSNQRTTLAVTSSPVSPRVRRKPSCDFADPSFWIQSLTRIRQ